MITSPVRALPARCDPEIVYSDVPDLDKAEAEQ
jgi:hypothetical protein